MGYYINPPGGETKEQWLQNHATRQFLPGEAPSSYPPAENDQTYVCLVNNGPFTAAGVIYSSREFNDWSDPEDRRPRLWFTVKKADLVAGGFIDADAFN